MQGQYVGSRQGRCKCGAQLRPSWTVDKPPFRVVRVSGKDLIADLVASQSASACFEIHEWLDALAKLHRRAELNMRLLLSVGLVAGASGLKLPTPQLQSLKAAAFGATCSAALCLGALPAIAAPPSLNDAIVEFTEAVYPVIKVQNSALPDLSEQAAARTFNSVKPEKLATSIDLLFDAFATVPEEKITAFNDVVKDAFGDAKPPACQLVPLPPKSLTDKVLASAAVKQVDSAKLADKPSCADISKRIPSE